MSILNKYKQELDPEVLKASEAEMESGGDFPEIPPGTYEVSIEPLVKQSGEVVHEGLENRQSKKGQMMISIVFNILAGEFEGQKIFYNKLYEGWDFMRHQNAEMLSDVLTDRNSKTIINEILKENNQDDIYQLCEEILDVASKHEYALKLGKNDKGYETYKIVDVFDLA